MGPLRAWILRLRMLVLPLVPLVFVAILTSSGLLVETPVRGEWYPTTPFPATFVRDPTHYALPSKETKENVLEDPINNAVELFNTPIEQEHLMFMKNTSLSSILLPPPMDLWRRGISLDEVYGHLLPPRDLSLHGRRGSSCSCLNPRVARKCCKRFIRLSHKMGTHMAKKLFPSYYPPRLLTVKGAPWPDEYPRLLKRGVDYRDVLIFRDIYAALKSGYLYHLSGMECWLDEHGRPQTNRRLSKPFRWFHLVALKVPASIHRNRSLCQFLQEENEKVGMRVYIDYAFNGDYKLAFALWAFAHAFPKVRERTRHACYEDFLSPTKDKQAIESSLSFLFNRTIDWGGNLTGQTAYSGPHAASHKADADQSKRLLQIIRELDEEVFDNEIAWVDSVLPC